MTSKLLSISEAAQLVPSNCTLAVGGITLYRRPVAFIEALLRRKYSSGSPQNLTLMTFTAGIECDWLVGSGMVQRVRTCYFGLEIFGLAPMFTYQANRGEIEIVEESESSLAFGLRAQMAGIGFMPARAWLGTDMPGLRPDVKTVLDPYSGEELMAFPAIYPDVAVIHALKADADGNALIGGNKGIDPELAIVAGQVIITTEELVPSLEKADIVAPLVSAIVLAPAGAAPTSCHPNYAMDGEAIMRYSELVSDSSSFDAYIKSRLEPTR